MGPKYAEAYQFGSSIILIYFASLYLAVLSCAGVSNTHTHTWSSAPIWSYRVGWNAPAMSRCNLLSAEALTSNFKPLHWLPLHYFVESNVIMNGKARSVTAGKLIKSLCRPLVRKRFSLRPPQIYKHDANRKAHNTDYNTKDNPTLSFDVFYTLRTSFTPQPDSYCYAVTMPLLSRFVRRLCSSLCGQQSDSYCCSVTVPPSVYIHYPRRFVCSNGSVVT